jgi:hypothetical protein
LSRRKVESEELLVAVMVVLRLLAHSERPGHGDLDPSFRVPAEELDVARLDRTFAPDRPDDARREIRDATRSNEDARIVDVEPAEHGRDAVRVALAPDLAVGNDVDSGELKVAKREQGRVVLGLLEPGCG